MVVVCLFSTTLVGVSVSEPCLLVAWLDSKPGPVVPDESLEGDADFGGRPSLGRWASVASGDR